MIYKDDLIKYLEKNSEKLDIKIVIEDDGTEFIYNLNGEKMCSVNDYMESLKQKLGCSFTSICYNHAFLENVLKCNKCGTVIITREDEDFDPKLKCPTCTDYKTYFNYYTKEEIESDDDIKKIIDAYIYMDKFQTDAYEYEKQHGHPYWEIFKKKIYTKNHMYRIELKCDDLRKSFFKGLHLVLVSFRKLNDPGTYSFSRQIIIPLSFNRIYLHWIYPHIGKCHKDFRSKWFIGKPIEKRNKKEEEK